MFVNFEIADIIAYYCASADNFCRQELILNRIVSERDYVSTLSTRIRDGLRNRFPITCHAQTVRAQVEHENGVDGIIVFKYRNEIKVGMFEAKRPQILQANYPWDIMNDRNTSHFSEQIQHQHRWYGEIALWAMFFNEGQMGYASPPFDYFGSSCVWHNNVYAFMNVERLLNQRWTTNALKRLLTNSCTNFYTIIYDILSCKEGKPFQVDLIENMATLIHPIDGNLKMEIPLPIDLKTERDERIDVFMEKHNLDNFMFINLDNM